MGKKFMGLGGTDHFWDRAKAWILNQITSAVTAKIAEVVANAPEDLDTLKEIADWISTHADDAAAMNTQITENKNNIAANSSSISAMNTQITENKNNIAANSSSISAMNTQITENKNNIAANSSSISAMNTQITENKNNIVTNASDISALKTSVAGKADIEHTHTKSQITDFPTSLKNPNALTVNGKTYDGSSAVDAGVQAVANGGTGATDAASGFNTLADGVRNSSTPRDDEKMLLKPTGTWYKTTCLDFWNYIKDKISSVLGLTKDNYGGKASTAGTADMARNMYYQNLDLSALDKTKFYPLVCYSGTDFAEVAICSESGMGSMEYNQNRIHFDISTQGWSDLRNTLNIREYTCYENNEITIGCIGRGVHSGAWAIWLRGGLHYTCFSRNSDLTLHTSDYTFGDEVYTVGTNYYGGSNTNVEVMFTPQSTITEGAYSSRPITAPRIKADYRMVIPIGAPSSLEDGCIWIER